MPAVSLVVCVYGQRDLLERLLLESTGCYDDLVVVHDGPDSPYPDRGIERLVAGQGTRFFVRPRAFQQEPHWPFAWAEAKHDWILRLDADEFPSEALKQWLNRFRQGGEPDQQISGYTCIWPLWNGKKQITERWPAGRIFLFNKTRVRFFGMVEQVPLADGCFEALPLILKHQPRRKSYGPRNVLLRSQAYNWRHVIAQSLLGKPTDLACWRWNDPNWPEHWEQIRRRPLFTAVNRLFVSTLRTLRDQWRSERRLFPVAALSGPLHHAFICLRYWQQNGRLPERTLVSEPNNQTLQ